MVVKLASVGNSTIDLMVETSMLSLCIAFLPSNPLYLDVDLTIWSCNMIVLDSGSTHIIAIDIDLKKIEYAQPNALFMESTTADTVFLSPQWGGPEYTKARNFDINTMLKPLDGQFLFNVAKEIAPRIVMFLPRNGDIDQPILHGHLRVLGWV
ncbi:WW domain-containing protein [Artemisia annua]|uniref:Trimethylguanosine synthase n=1 Tax=Artemisia annua TaxID=35608 RepID=A0A2U1LT16_ARTAN|nr:WW domain-containing protein [Artemisia annua]